MEQFEWIPITFSTLECELELVIVFQGIGYGKGK